MIDFSLYQAEVKICLAFKKHCQNRQANLRMENHVFRRNSKATAQVMVGHRPRQFVQTACKLRHLKCRHVVISTLLAAALGTGSATWP